MGSWKCISLCVLFVLGAASTAFSQLSILDATSASFQLSPDFYKKKCPNALETIKRVVEDAVRNESRMGASLLRLHFHDCFVQGCDASVLLDPSPTIDSEKEALPNKNSIRGFEVVDKIKSEVDKACGGPVVSCADILAVAARDSVVALGGPTWKLRLGRRDSTTANRTKANEDLPGPFLDLPALLQAFQKQGLNREDLVALSGGHTIGFTKCAAFRDRIYNETNIDPDFAKLRQQNCPRVGNDANLAPFDPTPANFDIAYFTALTQLKGLLHSDQQLFNGGSTDSIVKKFRDDPNEFRVRFGKSMIRMGNINPLTGDEGQVRLNCRVVNTAVADM